MSSAGDAHMNPSIIHLFGKTFAPAVRTYARAADLIAPEGSSLDKTAQKAYNVGNSISDPNQVYTGGGFDNNASFAQVQQPTNQQPGNDANPGVTFVEGATNGGGGGAGGGSLSSGQINSIYDTRIGRLRSLLDRTPSQQQSALDQYNLAYDQNYNSLNSSYNQGKANLDFQSQQNQNQRAKSYRDIAQGIRNTLESGANRLGTMNALDSSASPMLAYALANLQAQQRGQANDVFNTNEQQIGMARTNMDTEFNNQINALQSEKRMKIQEIADKYATIRQQIADEIANSDAQRAYELANIGQQYTMQALSDIQGLEDTYNQASNSWVQSALASMPKANTTPFGQTATQSNYGMYGRGTGIQDNLTDYQLTDAYDQAGLPVRKNKDQFAF